MKNIRVFLSENFQFLEVKFSIYLNRRVFVMKHRRLLSVKPNIHIRTHLLVFRAGLDNFNLRKPLTSCVQSPMTFPSYGSNRVHTHTHTKHRFISFLQVLIFLFYNNPEISSEFTLTSQ